MIGRKIYYELATGDVVLITPEKHNSNAVNTTKEQDFQMYDVLAARSPDTIGVIQLEYRQNRAEFQSSRSVKVDLETGDLVFEFPVYEKPLTEQVEQLKTENAQLTANNQAQQSQIADLESQLEITQTALAEFIEMTMGGQ